MIRLPSDRDSLNVSFKNLSLDINPSSLTATKYGGERGIRTPDPILHGIIAFEATAFNRSAISPASATNTHVYNTSFYFF